MKPLPIVLLLLAASTSQAQEQPAKPAARVPRVLLLADMPSREFQFVRGLLSRRASAKLIELSMLLQSAEVASDVLWEPGVPLLAELPADSLGSVADPGAKRFDVIIALDPNWKKLPAELVRWLPEWVNRGGGLICVAGVHGATALAARRNPELIALQSLLPARLKPAYAKDWEWRERPFRLRIHDRDGLLKLESLLKINMAGLFADLIELERGQLTMAEQWRTQRQRLEKELLKDLLGK